jgi:superfamily II DNA or RNA helicase
MEVRPYQTEQVNQAIREVSLKRKVLIQLPTGGGKTYEFAMIAKRYIDKIEKSVLVIVHREELMNQAKSTLEFFTGKKCRLIDRTTKKRYDSEIYIAMIDSLINRLDLITNVGLIIIDEAHIASFNKIHEFFGEELLLGFTATPISSSLKRPINGFYSSIVTGPQISELIKNRYLAQNVTRIPKNLIDKSKFEVDKMTGDFKEKYVADEYSRAPNIANTVKAYDRYCKGEKTLIFNVNIDHSKMVDQILNIIGVNSRHIDAGSSSRPSIRPGFKSEREEILDWFKYSEDAVLNNVMIVTVGFDEPTVLNIILNFDTMSLTKYIQCSGRGGRKIPGKDYFRIIDMGSNWTRFGDWSDDRDWNEIFNNPAKAGTGMAPYKTCPQCEGLIHASLMTCPLINEVGEICGYNFDKGVAKEEIKIDDWVVVTEAIVEENKINKDVTESTFFSDEADRIIDNMLSKSSSLSQDRTSKAFSEYYGSLCNWWRKEMANRNDSNIKDITSSAWHIRRARGNFDVRLKMKQKGFDKKVELNLFS